MFWPGTQAHRNVWFAPDVSIVMIAHMRLRSAMLHVKDLERMKQFYGDMLGVKPTNQEWTEVLAIFETGGAMPFPPKSRGTSKSSPRRSHVKRIW